MSPDLLTRLCLARDAKRRGMLKAMSRHLEAVRAIRALRFAPIA